MCPKEGIFRLEMPDRSEKLVQNLMDDFKNTKDELVRRDRLKRDKWLNLWTTCSNLQAADIN